MSVHHERHETRELHKKQEALIQKRLNCGFGAIVLAFLAILLAIVIADARYKAIAIVPLAAAGYCAYFFLKVFPPQIESLQSQIHQKAGR